MLTAMNVATDDKIAKLKVRNAISVAKDLASIIERTSPKDTKSPEGAKILIYAPQVAAEASYEVIEVPTNGSN
jgi:hypothetical protein